MDFKNEEFKKMVVELEHFRVQIIELTQSEKFRETSVIECFMRF